MIDTSALNHLLTYSGPVRIMNNGKILRLKIENGKPDSIADSVPDLIAWMIQNASDVGWGNDGVNITWTNFDLIRK